MRNKILHDSMLYFARNGFSGTKISDLAKHIGIGQGTMMKRFVNIGKSIYFRDFILMRTIIFANIK